MDQQRDSVRKTFKYKLKPTPDQEQALHSVLWHCRALYNAGLEQRKTWWERGQGKSATYYEQTAELPDLNRQLKAAGLAPLRPDLAPPRDVNAALNLARLAASYAVSA